MEREAKPQPPDRLAAFRALTRYQAAYQTAVQDGFSNQSMAAWLEARTKLESALLSPGKFPLGQTSATRGAIEAMREASHHPAEFLIRHKHGDWGELDSHDRKENERSLRLGYRLLSAYGTRHKEQLWVITEADRSSTVLLLPSEY
jgi:hypothetical protein